MTREQLQTWLKWLTEVVLPAALAGDNLGYAKRVKQHIADIRWRLAPSKFPRPAPSCGWSKPYFAHGEVCPKQHPHCQAQFDRWDKAVKDG